MVDTTAGCWTKLSDPKKTMKRMGSNGGGNESKKDDPLDDMMKQMYDDGNDKMRKFIGDTMMKGWRIESRQTWYAQFWYSE